MLCMCLLDVILVKLQVPTSAKYYTKYIAPFPSAVAVLKSAGFKPNADGTMLVIKHRNLAAVIAVLVK